MQPKSRHNKIRVEDAPMSVGQLTDRLGEIPDLREDRLHEVRQRITNGDYLTRDVAECVAATMLSEHGG